MDNSQKKGNDELNAEEPTATSQAEGQDTGTSELEKLHQQLEAKAIEAQENYDRYLRNAAELENIKKRLAREKAEGIRFANENLMRDLLPTLDNLVRAVEHAKGGNGQPLLEGLEMVLKGLLDALNRHGLTQISALGETFDPEKHEAFAQVERPDCAPNTVVEEYNKGYYFFDRLLRPALVTLSKLPESKEKKSDQEEVEKGNGDD
jgi:molecular chaperone GrpE